MQWDVSVSSGIGVEEIDEPIGGQVSQVRSKQARMESLPLKSQNEQWAMTKDKDDGNTN